MLLLIVLTGQEYLCLDSFAQSESGSQTSSQSFRTIDTPQTDIGVPLFPTATSVEGQYYQSVLLALERWFSFFGWVTGPHPITIPHTLRRYVWSGHTCLFSSNCWSIKYLVSSFRIISEDAVNNPKGQAQGVSQKKDARCATMVHWCNWIRLSNFLPGCGFQTCMFFFFSFPLYCYFIV